MAQQKGINLHWIDDLKARADIYSVVSSYVNLEKKGSKYWACCPFHAERTPSFAVDEVRGSWVCFGACHEGGDAISFEMKINDIDFTQAVTRLAKRYGYVLPESFAFEKKDKASDKEYEMMVAAARFYRNNLVNTKFVQDYLATRNITPQTSTQFGLGYSKDWNSLVEHLSSKGYSKKMMLDCGLISENNGRFSDSLGGRLIVPIFDSFGKVVAFGGRILKKPPEGKAVAKYKNTKETKLFVKNKVLYGLNFVRKARIGNPIKDIVIVEGYMDVIGLHQAGIKNAVASMGTSLTDNQAKLIKNMVNTVYICYDGDFAGQKSTLRGLDILKAHELEVKIMTMPDGMDPDELVANGPEPFNELKDKAMDLYDYLLFRAQDGLDLTTSAGKIAYAKKAVEVISDFPKIERDTYLEKVREKTGIAKTTLAANLVDKKEIVEVVEQKEQVDINPILATAEYKAGKFVLNSLVVKEDLFEDRLDREIFVTDTQKLFFDYIVECLSVGRKPIASTVYNIDGVNPKEVSAILETNVDISEFKSYYNDCVVRLLRKYYTDKKQTALQKMNKCFDANEKSKYYQEYNTFNTKLKELNCKN